MANVDYIEVNRITYELQERMGWIVARKYAARLTAESLADGILEDYEFWRAVGVASDGSLATYLIRHTDVAHYRGYERASQKTNLPVLPGSIWPNYRYRPDALRRHSETGGFFS